MCEVPPKRLGHLTQIPTWIHFFLANLANFHVAAILAISTRIIVWAGGAHQKVPLKMAFLT
jgi:hypothetical protein